VKFAACCRRKQNKAASKLQKPYETRQVGFRMPVGARGAQNVMTQLLMLRVSARARNTCLPKSVTVRNHLPSRVPFTIPVRSTDGGTCRHPWLRSTTGCVQCTQATDYPSEEPSRLRRCVRRVRELCSCDPPRGVPESYNESGTPIKNQRSRRTYKYKPTTYNYK
jgi:hypothetical protein